MTSRDLCLIAVGALLAAMVVSMSAGRWQDALASLFAAVGLAVIAGPAR